MTTLLSIRSEPPGEPPRGFFFAAGRKWGLRPGLTLVVLLGGFLATLGCQGNTQPDRRGQDTVPRPRPAPDASIAGNFSPQTRLRFDSARVAGFLTRYPELREFGPDIRKFYRNRGYAYAWFDSRGRIESCLDLYNRILNLTDEGVPYHVPYLQVYKGMIEGDSIIQPRMTADPEAELMMTAQYLHYAKDAWKGLPESQSREVEWFLPRKRLDYAALLDSMTGPDGTVSGIGAPVNQQYLRLKTFLLRYRAWELAEPWPVIRSDRRRLSVGDTGRSISAIRHRLQLLGDLPKDDGSPWFDQTLEGGVRSFQRRHGLRDDGVVGAGVLRALNIPIRQRIQQIVVNMERARWLAQTAPGEHLVVNIPQFELMVYSGDSLAWSCPVVVGKDANRTAVFQADMRYIVFSPYWNVPASILQKEILPAMSRNPDYLRQNDMEWQGKGVRQRPGPENALGRVKFLFPNSFSMYLHDTPAKTLFSQEKRAFSHGCIRVSEPRRLAMHLLRNDTAWTAQRIDEAMSSGVERHVRLGRPVPVSIIYLTAWVDDSGRIQFRDDIYQKDERLMEMIFSKK